MSLAPPPPPPPAQPLSSLGIKTNSKDDRSMLLDSIRKGTTLKKTVTNDKSAPLISGNATSKSSLNSNTNSLTRSSTTNKNEAVSPPAGLGGLFANGIPKLKATGLPIGQAYQQYRNENDKITPGSFSNNNSSNNGSCNHISSNNIKFNNTNSSTRASFTKTRGPPPQPPGFLPKNNSPDTETNNGLPVHNRSGSAVSLNDNSYQNRASDVGQHIINHGKPTLAPKPNSIVKSVGNKIRSDGRPMVSRAQSMRVNRTTLNVADSDNGPQYPESNQSELYRMNNRNNLPSFHQSQESLGRKNMRSSSPPRMSNNATSWGSSLNSVNATMRRPHGSPMRPPSSKPPPPPRMLTGPPTCPPPPPPTHAPPPPPHRINPAPPPPRLTNNFQNSSAPPVPPVRNSSMKGSMTSFESRFIFHNVDEFPPPQPYQNVIKIYNSRMQAKQQAPLPPLQLQQQSLNRMWQCENASNC